MKKSFLALMMTGLSFILAAQQPFNVKVQRHGSIFSQMARISLYYQGEKKGDLKKKVPFTLTGVLPADSIIELKFKVPMQSSTKFFLYPNADFNYTISANSTYTGIHVKDLSEYNEGGLKGVSEKQKVLPKGMTVNKKNLSISYVHEKTLSSEEIRKQWLRQGGRITGSSISYIFMYTALNEPPMSMIGVGGGWTFTRNHYTLHVPEYKQGLTTWTSAVWGSGYSINMMGTSTKIKMEEPMEDIEANGGAMSIMISGNVGLTLGLGKFKTETDYKGYAFDFTYKPSIILTGGDGGSDTQFNYKGFGLDISRNSFSAFANRLAPKAKSKFSFFMLPPLKDTPFMFTFGYGRVWYR